MSFNNHGWPYTAGHSAANPSLGRTVSPPPASSWPHSCGLVSCRAPPQFLCAAVTRRPPPPTAQPPVSSGLVQPAVNRTEKPGHTRRQHAQSTTAPRASPLTGQTGSTGVVSCRLTSLNVFLSLSRWSILALSNAFLSAREETPVSVSSSILFQVSWGEATGSKHSSQQQRPAAAGADVVRVNVSAHGQQRPLLPGVCTAF